MDTRKERNAIAEAHKLNIPVVAIADTNCDPDEIDYVIPGNDDAIRAIKLISSIMANAVLEGKQGEQTEEAAAEEALPLTPSDLTRIFVNIPNLFGGIQNGFYRS